MSNDSEPGPEVLVDFWELISPSRLTGAELALIAKRKEQQAAQAAADALKTEFNQMYAARMAEKKMCADPYFELLSGYELRDKGGRFWRVRGATAGHPAICPESFGPGDCIWRGARVEQLMAAAPFVTMRKRW